MSRLRPLKNRDYTGPRLQLLAFFGKGTCFPESKPRILRMARMGREFAKARLHALIPLKQGRQLFASPEANSCTPAPGRFMERVSTTAAGTYRFGEAQSLIPPQSVSSVKSVVLCFGFRVLGNKAAMPFRVGRQEAQ